MSSTKLNFTVPEIVTNNNLEHRSFIKFHFNGKPIREYHGKNLGQKIDPNRAKSLDEKKQLLKKLQFELHKALEAGVYPFMEVQTLKTPPVIKEILIADKEKPKAILLLFQAIRAKLRSDLSKKYKRNLKAVYRQFKEFMTNEELSGALTAISTIRIDSFLSQYNSTGTYYMNKRRDLGVLFSEAGRMLDQPVLVIKKSSKKKSKAKLHKPYEKEQLKYP